MRTATNIILKQLENEGVKHEELWHFHWLATGQLRASNHVFIADTFTEAVDDALAQSIRITALLSKLKDSLTEPEGCLGDLLIEQTEIGA